MMAKWDTGENPIYKQATSTFKNPTYAGKNKIEVIKEDFGFIQTMKRNKLQNSRLFVVAKGLQQTDAKCVAFYRISTVPHLCGRRVENCFGKTTCGTPELDWNPDLPFIDRLVYCESEVLDHAATEAGRR
uniref:Integrin beta subunit cytoplasmic domain-containing protein n=1 Tax=Timema cristinae TaxID=61476 RepID=A0A7R9GSP2_TIMCR|nr:unnamed protein product [Timema cristinae]